MHIPTGINVIEIDYWTQSNPFNNLIYGETPKYVSSEFSGSMLDMPAVNLDADHWPKSLPNAGAWMACILSQPVSTGTYAVSWEGNMTGMFLSAGPGSVSGFDNTAKTATLTITAVDPESSVPLILKYGFTDTVNYPKNIAIVKTGSSGRFTTRFLQDCARFNGIRFMKWKGYAVENNFGNQTAWAGGTAGSPTRTVLWANRNTVTGRDWKGYDGVPIEVMVELANAVKVLNPAFSFIHICLPWNADDAYITNNATYARDNLSAGIECRFECANEVWNSGFAVEKQAYNEGVSVGTPTLSDLGHGEYGWAMTRYAQRTYEMMTLISTVYSGQMSRVKRLYCGQHANAGITREVFDWMSANHPTWLASIDMLGTAPYFSTDSVVWSYTGDKQIVFDGATTYIDGYLTGSAVTHKATAVFYAKALTTYEAGASFFFSDQNYMASVQRDSRMYDLYRHYLTWMETYWSSQIQFAMTHPLAAVNAWGLKEYEGQTISLATTPKFQAVIDYLAS